MGDDLIKSVGIGNLSRVLAHGEELGVKRVKPQEPDKAKDKGVRYEIPSDPPVPGKRIYDDAIMRFEQSRPKGEDDTNRIVERRNLACETAKSFQKGGLDAFVDDLAKGMGVKAEDRYSRAAMTRIAEQLFASKAVTWWARNVLEREARAVVAVDLTVGRGITRDRLLDAAATLTVMVRRGELDLEHVETYLNETVYDYADKKTVVQMTARAMGEMRAKVLEFGWGKRYADLVKRYSQAVNVAPEVKLKFEALRAKADAIRKARRGMVQELGLDGVMIRADDDVDTVLSAFRDRLKSVGSALELSRHSYGVSGCFDDEKNFAGAEVGAFHEAAEELEKLLGGVQKPVAPEGWEIVDEFADKVPKTGFTTSFRDSIADSVKLLDQGLELTARLEREEEIRAAFKEAISGIETGENGLCQPGVYQLSIAVDVGTGFGLGVEGAKASVKGKLGVQVTVAIGEDGSASVAHGFSAGLEIGAEVKIPAVKVKGCVDASAAIKNSTNYKSIDDMCNGMSRAVLAIATGKELGNIFHAGSANAKSMAMSRRLDNYAMRAHLGNLGLLDDTDRYLTPLRNDKVAGETKSGTFKGGAKLSVSAGSDEDTFLKKSGFNANFSGSLGATLSTTIKYRTHFDVARDEKPEDLKPPLSPDEILARETQIKNRLVELRAELEDFTRAAAAQSGGSKSQYARPNKSYRQHLANRGIVLTGWNAFRNIFQGNIRRTLFLADLARDAANCEAQLRSLQAMKPAAAQPGAEPEPVVLPEDAEHTIRMIEEGIYGRCGVQLNEAVAKNCLYVTDEKRKVAMSSGIAANAGFVVPHTATAPGLSAAVTFGFSYDPEHPNLEPRPWDTRGSTSIAIGFTDMPGADAIVDLVMSKLDELMPVNDLLAFGGREFVAKQVNDFIKEHAKDWVSPSGPLSDKIAHTLTFNIVRTGTGLRLGDISLSRSHIQSISANTPDLLVSASLSLSRTSDKVLRCSLGTNTLNGLMSRYERYGKNPVLWESLLQQQGENVAELAKNMLEPPDVLPPVKPRAGVAGELDMILQQMIRNGNRTSLEAFVKAWAEVKAVADGGNAKSCGAALTKLFKVISAFYEDENWRTEQEMPVEGQAKTVQKKPAEDKSPADQLDNLQQIGKVLVESQQLPKFAVQTTKSSLCHMWSVVNALRMSEAGNRYLDNVVKINAQNGSFMAYDEDGNGKEITEAFCKERLNQTEDGKAFVDAVENKFKFANLYERTFLYYTYLNDKGYQTAFQELLNKSGEYLVDCPLPYGNAERTAKAFNLVVEDGDLSLDTKLLDGPVSQRVEAVKKALQEGGAVVLQKDGHFVAVKAVDCDDGSRTLTVTAVDSMDGKESKKAYSFDELNTAYFAIYKMPDAPQ